MSTVLENWYHVKDRIEQAAIRSGRTAKEVTLVAVSKYTTPQSGFVQTLIEAGCRDFGEARPQSLIEKAEFFKPRAEQENTCWHLIGPLQRNKIRRILPLCSWIHSVDSLKLLEAIDRIVQEEESNLITNRENPEGGAANLPLCPFDCRDFNSLEKSRGNQIGIPSLLLEVNISSESSKQGFEPNELPYVLEQLARFPRLPIRGLMGMSGLNSDAGQKRKEFESLRLLAEANKNNCPPHVFLNELSIGMSDDFEIAIEEGATLVRIGSILYESQASC